MAWLADDFDPILGGDRAESLIAAQAGRGLRSLRRFPAGRDAALDNARTLADTSRCSGRGRPAATAHVRARMSLVKEQALKQAVVIGVSFVGSVGATAAMTPGQAG